MQSVTRCPFCGAPLANIIHDMVEWQAQSMEDGDNLAKVVEHQCVKCQQSFWTDPEAAAPKTGQYYVDYLVRVCIDAPVDDDVNDMMDVWNDANISVEFPNDDSVNVLTTEVLDTQYAGECDEATGTLIRRNSQGEQVGTGRTAYIVQQPDVEDDA